MNAGRDPGELLRGIPGWRDRSARLSRLPGGLNNTSYRVDAGDERYVLRVASEASAASVRDHELELRVQQLAAGQGLAARVVFADPTSGILLAEYLPGKALAPADLDDRRTLAQLAELLRRLHQLPRCGRDYAPQAAADAYLAALGENAPPFAATCRRIIAEAGPPERLACCHNDVVAENVIRDDGLKLIDFEYARDNEPLFDLASVIGWHNLDDRAARYLLDCYAGGLSAAEEERLQDRRRLFDAIQYLWLAARQAVRRVPAEVAQMQRVAARLG